MSTTSGAHAPSLRCLLRRSFSGLHLLPSMSPVSPSYAREVTALPARPLVRPPSKRSRVSNPPYPSLASLRRLCAMHLRQATEPTGTKSMLVSYLRRTMTIRTPPVSCRRYPRARFLTRSASTCSRNHRASSTTLAPRAASHPRLLDAPSVTPPQDKWLCFK